MGEQAILVVFRVIDELLEECTLNAIPVTMKHHFSSLLRQGLKLCHIVRVTLHKGCVVIHLCRDEYIIFRPFLAFVSSVHK